MIRTRRAWFRPARRTPPEVAFLAFVIALGLFGYLMSVHSAVRAGVFKTDIAPACADARQPCRGRA